MATLAQIYDWFMTAKKPTQAQFWSSWGSFRHKDDAIPQSDIANLTTVLNAKAETSQLAGKVDKVEGKSLLSDEEIARLLTLENQDLSLKADLVDGEVPLGQLPEEVFNVIQFYNLAAFPAVGKYNTVYIDDTTNLTYKWNGATYVQIGGQPYTAGSGIDITANQISAKKAYKSITGNVTIDNSYNNAIVLLKANATITFPTGLDATFNMTVFCYDLVTGTYVAGAGASIDAQSDGLVQSGKSIFQVVSEGANSFIVRRQTSVKGTANYLQKVDSNGNLVNSLIYGEGTSVGIGTTSPGAMVHIKSPVNSDTPLAFLVTNLAGTVLFRVNSNNGVDIGNFSFSSVTNVMSFSGVKIFERSGISTLYGDPSSAIIAFRTSGLNFTMRDGKARLGGSAGGATDSTALLEIQGTNGGFLLPRMTQAQRLALVYLGGVPPAIGLQVYQTDGVEGVYIHKTTGWQFAY